MFWFFWDIQGIFRVTLSVCSLFGLYAVWTWKEKIPPLASFPTNDAAAPLKILAAPLNGRLWFSDNKPIRKWCTVLRDIGRRRPDGQRKRCEYTFRDFVCTRPPRTRRRLVDARPSPSPLPAAAAAIMETNAIKVLHGGQNWPNLKNGSNGSIFDKDHLPEDMQFTDANLIAIVAYSILLVISAIGNITVLTIILKRRRTAGTRIHAMLMHLAIADLLVSNARLGPAHLKWPKNILKIHLHFHLVFSRGVLFWS